MAHGHDVLHMMEGNCYPTKESLVKAIIEKFGADERFHTCSVEGMTAAAGTESFTVDATKICNH